MQRRSGHRSRAWRPTLTPQSAFSVASGLWPGLDSADRVAWDTFAGGAGLGQSAFVRSVSGRFTMLGFWDVSIPERGPLEGPGDVTLTSSAAAQSLVVAWTNSSPAGLLTVAIWVAVFASVAVQAPCCGWVGPVAGPGPSAASIDIGSVLASHYNLIQRGRSLGVRLAFWSHAQARMSGAVEARCVVEA